MTTIRPFRCSDMLRFNNVNLDQWTETYNPGYYFTYMGTWPSLTLTAETSDGRVAGYLLAKVEGKAREWHGHVTAITVAPEYRRLGLASWFMKHLEQVSDRKKCYFVDLFVRASNDMAIGMYTRLGYTTYRRVVGYYTGGQGEKEEDALDMRKALSADAPDFASVVPLDPLLVPAESLQWA